MRERTFTLALVIFPCLLTQSCGSRPPGSDSNAKPGDADVSAEEETDPVNLTIETFVAPLQVVAGQEVTAACVASKDRKYLADIATQVFVLPDAGSVTAGGSNVTFSPTAVGEYVVRCETADGLAVDDKGITVEVVAAAPALVATTVSDNVAEAGAPVQADCEVFDAFLNFIPERDHDKSVSLMVSSPLQIDPPSGPGFTVRGTSAGDYEVACAYGDLGADTHDFVDETPEPLTVVPGIPGHTETIVAPGSLSPTEEGNITCVVTDDFGNELPDVETTVVVMVADGSPASAAGLTFDATSMSATLAETYFVACKVPAFFAGDETPAVVKVNPGLPHHWVVELPDQDCFWQDRGLPLLYIVYDQWGNEVAKEDYDVTVWSTPAGVTRHEDVVRVPLEGDFTIWVDLATTVVRAPNSVITAEASAVRVDSTPPAVNITTPERATAFEQDETEVAISGEVSDVVSAIESLEINGKAIAVTGGSLVEPINQIQNSTWGLNLITGSAVDECGNRRVIAQSYLRSGQYFTAATWPAGGARASSGIVAHLNQPVIDDNDPNDADDLVTIIGMIISGMDLNAVIPGTIADTRHRVCRGCWPLSPDCGPEGFRISKNGTFTYSEPSIHSLVAVDNGLFLDLSISNLVLPLRVQGWYVLPCRLPDIYASVTGVVTTTSVAASTTLSVSLSGGAPHVNICSSCLNINIQNPEVDIDWGILDFLDFLFNAIVNAIIGMFEGQIEGLLEDTLRDEIPPLIADFLAGFTLDTGFDVPAPLDMELKISSGFDYLDFEGPPWGGYGQLGLFAQVFPEARAPAIPATAAGAIRRRPTSNDPAGPGPGFSDSQYDFGLSLEDDVLNQALWAIWYGGGLELDLSEILDLAGGYDLDGVDLTISARSPPVIMPGGDGNQVHIGLGDAYIDATVDLGEVLGNPNSTAPPLHVGMYLSTILGGAMDLNSATNELQIWFDPEPEIHVEVVAIDDEGYQGVMTDLFTGLMKVLLPPALASIIGSFPIPSFDLSGLAGLPPGTVLQLGNGDLGRPNTSGYCLAGTEKMDATHFCLTGILTNPP